MNDELNDVQQTDESLHTKGETSGKKKAASMLEQFQVLTMKQLKGSGDLDLSALTNEQKDKLLDIMSKNEDHAFEYSKLRIKSSESISSQQIEASIVDQKTIRWIAVLAIIVLAIIGLVILIFKDSFFISYLTFVAGLIGGTGLRFLFGKRKATVINSSQSSAESE